MLEQESILAKRRQIAARGVRLPLTVGALAFCLHFLVVSASISGAQTDPAKTGGASYVLTPDIKRIKDRGKLIVAQYSGESPVFFMVMPKGSTQFPEHMRFELPDGKTICGIDIAIAVFLAKLLHVELELKREYTTYRAVVDAVAKGEADVGISNLSVTFDRLQTVRFSQPYANFSFCLLLNRQAVIQKKITLNAKSSDDDFDRHFNKPDVLIGVMEWTASQEQLPVIFPKARAVPFKTGEELIAALRAQKIDGILDDNLFFLYAMMMDPELHLYCEMLKVPNSPQKIAAAINPESPTLEQMMDEISTYITVESPEVLLKKYEGILKSAEAAAGRPTPTGSATAEKATESHGPRTKLSAGALPAVGLPLVVLAIIWLRMSRRRSHGVRAVDEPRKI